MTAVEVKPPESKPWTPPPLSPILTGAVWLSDHLAKLTLRHHLQDRWPRLRDRPSHALALLTNPEEGAANATAIDKYVLCWLSAAVVANLTVLLLQPPVFTRIIVAAIFALRILEMLRATFGVALLDRYQGRPDNIVYSRERLVLLALLNYFELILTFSLIYAADSSSFAKSAGDSLEPLYFSLTTQLTITFGEPIPEHFLRYVAGLQGLFGILFLATIIARMVGSQGSVPDLFDRPNDAGK